MATPVGIEEVQANLRDIIGQLGPHDEVVITENDRPIARLIAVQKGQPQFGNCKGMLTIVADDDDHLQDFEEFMP